MRAISLTATIAAFMLAVVAEAHGGDEKRVVLTRTPGHGIQPQAVVDGKGVLHLIYYKGDPAAGNLFYVRREPGQQHFSDPVQVNSQPGTAIAIGTIRGGQLAIGKGGRLHVAWNGSGKAQPPGPGKSSPMLYSRLDDRGTAFEPQRNLMRVSTVLDGGGSVAADLEGNVYVVWHGLPVDSERGEINRKVWVARSTDEGKTFAQEAPAWTQRTGACGCCGLRAFADHKGGVYMLYRGATDEGTERAMYLLGSGDHGKSFHEALAHPWKIDGCPMSSEAFAEGPGGVLAAWETRGQVYFSRLGTPSGKAGPARAAPGEGNGRKHPALAVNRRGEMILAWTEGTGWERGGALAWQVYDARGEPTAERGRSAGAIPVWGLPAAVACPDNVLEIIY
jgi:hypothetical protein